MKEHKGLSLANAKCVSLQIHTVQVLGSVAFERPWVELGLLACRMFGGSSVFSCLVIFYQTTQIKDISGKLRLHSHQVKPYMYMFLPSFLAASKNRVLSIHSHLFLVSFLKILPVLMQHQQRGLITITGMTVFCSTSTYYSREHHHIALKSLCFAIWAGTNTHG